MTGLCLEANRSLILQMDAAHCKHSIMDISTLSGECLFSLHVFLWQATNHNVMLIFDRQLLLAYLYSSCVICRGVCRIRVEDYMQ